MRARRHFTWKYMRTLRREGYCIHGKYVGGCGIDWMCGACEDGEPKQAMRDSWLRKRPEFDVTINGHDITNFGPSVYALIRACQKSGQEVTITKRVPTVDGWQTWRTFTVAAK